MKRMRFGYPEKIVPSKFCRDLRYKETNISYDTEKFQFKTTARGCVLEFPLEADEQVCGFGLQLKEFNHKNHKLQLRTNSAPRCKHRRQPCSGAVFCDHQGLRYVL